MRTKLVILALCIPLAAAAAFVASDARAAGEGCNAGITTFGGASARVFCGPANATVHASGKTFTITGGLCEKHTGWFTLNLGEIVIGPSGKSKPEYFGVALGREAGGTDRAAGKDGTYHGGIVAVVHAGKGYPLRGNATVTLAGGRNRGTF